MQKKAIMATSISSEALWKYKKFEVKEKAKRKQKYHILTKIQEIFNGISNFYIYVFCSLTDRQTAKIYIE